MENSRYRGRLAPTPSGLLHVGHAQTFKTAWERARSRGGKIILRIEDIDTGRCKKKYADAAIEDLKFIGLDWDEGPDVGGEYAPYLQSERFGYYWSLVEKLSELGCVYPCDASRAQVKTLGKKQAHAFDFAEPETIFPNELRRRVCSSKNVEKPSGRNWRFAVPEGASVTFTDGNFGEMTFRAGEDFGDFLVWRKAGEPSYELAVTADDAAMKITEVVRGKDLLLSTARQILLYWALGFDIPQFFHCPLLTDERGEKLSKSSMEKSGGNGRLIRSRK